MGWNVACIFRRDSDDTSDAIDGEALTATVSGEPTTFEVSGTLPTGVSFDTSNGTFIGPSSWPGAAQVAYGYDHACAITLTGGLMCWGDNTHGKLGDGTTTDRSAPVAVIGMSSGVTDVTAGLHHTCAVQSGVAKCWGQNHNGQLGNGTQTNTTTPVVVSTLGNDVIDIETTRWQSATCAIAGTSSANHVWCWGWSQHMGISSNSPAIKAGIANVREVRVSEQNACAITNSSELYCWGYNDDGQLGNGTTAGSISPVLNLLGSDVTDVSLGQGHGCAIKNRTLYCWGYNYGGQLGDGAVNWTANPTPTTPAGMAYNAATGIGISAVYTGQASTCAVRSDGKVFCWGQIVPGTGSDFSVGSFPTELPALNGKVLQMDGGHYSMCAVLTSGDLDCWGFNNVGQIGNGSTSYAFTPVTVSGFDADAGFPATVTVTASKAGTSTSVVVTLTANRFAPQTTSWSFTGNSVYTCRQGFFYVTNNTRSEKSMTADRAEA